MIHGPILPANRLFVEAFLDLKLLQPKENSAEPCIVEPCDLYPIALSATTPAGVAPGSMLPDIFNGNQPGNFGWLTWAGNPSVPTLTASLTPPGNSETYVNPANAGDHVVSVGDWVHGTAGVSNSINVRTQLEMLKTIDINVPIWESRQGQTINKRSEPSAKLLEGTSQTAFGIITAICRGQTHSQINFRLSLTKATIGTHWVP